MLEERLQRIQHLLFTQGPSSVSALAELTHSSEATIRRDLDRLEQLGLVERTRGGAKLAHGAGIEVAFQAREHQHVAHKRAIAQTAYEHLRSNSTILLDAGTTVLQLARIIRLNPLPITIITNSLAVAQEVLGVGGINLYLLGGQVRPENLSSVGMYTEEALRRFWADQLFLGSNAVHLEQGLSSFDPQEASINRVMLERAETRYLLADSSKFDSRAMHHVAPLSSLQHVITDSRLPTGWRDALGQLNIELEVAD
jgi:DeoR/GlpR family transcriptional regulator of sugar metabolism